MSYRVDYETGRRLPRKRRLDSLRLPLLSILFLFIFLILVNAFWPSGASTLRRMLLPGDAAATKQALETLTDQLQSGVSIVEAIESFCREIIVEAGIVDH